jgi:hypothetical protein
LLRFIKAFEMAELEPDPEALRRSKFAVKFPIPCLGFLEVAEDVDSPIDHT